MRYLTGVLAVFLASAAMAQNQQFLSADGALFDYETNQHGAVLTSVEPHQGGIVAAEGTAPAVKPGQVLYLGRACDAFSRKFGEGRWSVTDGGFFIEFGTLSVLFPGQQIDFVRGNRCRA